MAANQEQISLYLQDTFDVPNPDPQQINAIVAAANDVAQSGFGTAILGQWHVHSDGSFYYNNSPLNSVISTLKVIPTVLTSGMVQNVLLTFGPFPSDFQNIKNNLELFKSTVLSIRTQTAIQGLDFDLEGNYSQYTDLLVELTQWAVEQGMMVTAAPYTQQSFWQGVLEKTNSGGAKGFSWWNLQLYGGANYGDWVGYLDGLVPDPQSFLVPGYNALYTTPSEVASALGTSESSYPDLNSGFIWKYESMPPSTAADYANSITAGVSDSWAGSRKVSAG